MGTIKPRLQRQENPKTRADSTQEAPTDAESHAEAQKKVIITDSRGKVIKIVDFDPFAPISFEYPPRFWM